MNGAIEENREVRRLFRLNELRQNLVNEYSYVREKLREVHAIILSCCPNFKLITLFSHYFSIWSE